MLESNKTILKKANQAVAEGDYEEFLRYCTHDTIWTLIGDRVLNGKEEVRNWMLDSYKQPPVNNVENLIGENDYLTVIGHITALNQDGITERFSYCDVWRFREGKMAELRAFIIRSDVHGDEL
ncbi:nuclear transport factor 2 family protein [Pedobacter sp. Leaf194]|uniref:nuclear transport factor 2 family protein n=1 Tax=Pedobacter sp. Leaf194 TaxID=1736297 RepID=UPI0007028BDC|nr:nuclear transport factor 2 family protein [Pedobacter sp. Leaf194]KQS36806.1 ketosteroid isomerase [Pedobacter sp. Leaf194]